MKQPYFLGLLGTSPGGDVGKPTEVDCVEQGGRQ
jgi:hypothetical protein